MRMARQGGCIFASLVWLGFVAACGPSNQTNSATAHERPALSPVSTDSPTQSLLSSPTAESNPVPDVIGSTSQLATGILSKTYSLQIRSAASKTIPAGRVASQIPAAGTSLAAGSLMTIVVSTGTVDPLTAPICSNEALKLTVGGGVSEKTGQHTLDLVVTNVSHSTCKLEGYPTVTLLDGQNRRVPFSYTAGGDQMTTDAAPQIVSIAPGQDAYVRINKYRCDIARQDVATVATLVPPGSTTPLMVPLGRYPVLDSCPEAPSLSVTVSPVEPSQRDLAPPSDLPSGSRDGGS